jgi:hypothetical protein
LDCVQPAAAFPASSLLRRPPLKWQKKSHIPSPRTSHGLEREPGKLPQSSEHHEALMLESNARPGRLL